MVNKLRAKYEHSFPVKYRVVTDPTSIFSTKIMKYWTVTAMFSARIMKYNYCLFLRSNIFFVQRPQKQRPHETNIDERFVDHGEG